MMARRTLPPHRRSHHPTYSFTSMLQSTHCYSGETNPEENYCCSILKESGIPTSITTTREESMWRHHLDALNQSLEVGGGYKLNFQGIRVLYKTQSYPRHTDREGYLPPGTMDHLSFGTHRSDEFRAYSFENDTEAAHEVGTIFRV
ncbi:unnamed protein product [Lactuca saligna]|uniref:Uncharacterized protein n=1 Tax=Lactuca saligna TaxID=75948 RepID=A0AA35ZVL8_LACSI|nr:unnamed protein product [Lactuca saligna]